MICTRVSLPGVGHAIVCRSGRRQPEPRCRCGEPAVALCDWPVRWPARGPTCDEPVCETHRKSLDVPGRELDYCPAHSARREELIERGEALPHERLHR